MKSAEFTLRMARVSTVLQCTAAAAVEASITNNSIPWSPLFDPGCGGDIVSVRSSPSNPNVVVMTGDMLGLTYSVDGGNSWLSPNAFDFSAYEMADVTFDDVNQRVYAASMTGMYYANYSDLSRWTNLRTATSGLPSAQGFGYGMPIQKILVEPANANHLLAFQGSKRGWDNGNFKPHMWESLDAGLTWTNVSYVAPVSGDETANIIAVDWAGPLSTQPGSNTTTRIWAATPGWGLWRSDDMGRTWSHMDAGLNTSYQFSFLVTHPTDPNTAYVSYGCDAYNGVYRTRDGGASWQAINNGITLGTGCMECLALSTSNPDILYVGAANEQSFIWKSTDGGDTWTQTGAPPSAQAYALGMGASFMSVDPSDENTVYYATWVTLWVSHDGGASWRDATAFQPYPESDKAGVVWRGTGFSGLVSRAFTFSPYNSSVSLFSAMDAGKIWTSYDNLYSFTRQSGLQEYGGGHDASFAADGLTIYAGTGQPGWPTSYSTEGVAYTTDGGHNWAYCGIPPNMTGQALQGNSVYTHPAAPQYVWAVYQDGHLYSSTNGCANWTQVVLRNATGGVYNDSTVANIRGPLTNGNSADPTKAVLYLQTQAGVYNSTNGGQTWTLMPGSPVATYGRAAGLAVSRYDNTTVWASVCCWDQWHVGAFAYSPATDKWSQVPGSNAIGSFKNFVESPRRTASGTPVYAIGTDMDPYGDVCSASGVYISVDGGQNWSQQALDLPMRRVSALAISNDGHTLIAGMNGRGYARLDIEGLYEAN